MIGKIPKMNKVEMVRSDVSGKLLKSDECEVIIIKIINGKDEDINSYSPFGRREEIKKEADPEIIQAFKDAVENTKKIVPQMDTSSKEYNESVQIKHSIIPKHMQDIFAPPPGM